MAKVQNSSSINITRVIGTAMLPLGNRIFNGYVYNLSLTVGFNGEPSSLILNLALNKTLKNVSKRGGVIDQRKKDIAATTRAQMLARSGSVDNQGGSGSVTSFSALADHDFDINENHIGIASSYDISIRDDLKPLEKYELCNFKIISYSISKKDNEKILTLTLHDNSIVLNKIFVGLLGQHVAIDQRSESTSVIENIKVYCPAVNLTPNRLAMGVQVVMPLHFAERQLAKLLKVNTDTCVIKSGTDDFPRSSKDPNFESLKWKNGDTGKLNNEKGIFNYITIESKNQAKSIQKGYGAVILLGEEELKDAPCSSSEVLYSFDTLLAAMKKLGIEISKEKGLPSLIDKSKGKIKRNFSGTLKDVLNQWCEEYSYSYVVDFAKPDKIIIKGIDLSTSTSKETVMLARLNLETLETTANSNFVIQSQDFDYDLSQKKLNLYSSYYFKEAKDQTTSSEKSHGDINFYNMVLNADNMFPQWFGVYQKVRKEWTQLDFCGAKRTYQQVVTSAVLGKFSSKLRQIYNYNIGAFEALGFLEVMASDVDASKLSLGEDKELLLEEAISAIVEIQTQSLFLEGKPLYNFNIGFYNQELVDKIERVEFYIADFIGKHYWTSVLKIQEGTNGNQDFLSKYEMTTLPASEKYYNNQIYAEPFIREGQSLIKSLSTVYEGASSYFTAYASFIAAAERAKDACANTTEEFIKKIIDGKEYKNILFHSQRASANYSVFEELLRQLETFEYSFGMTGDHYRINLADIYAPGFKELSPVSLGLFQAVLPINISALMVADFKFGMLYSMNEPIFTFKEIPTNFTLNGAKFDTETYLNNLEFQNQIRSVCLAMGASFDNAIIKNYKDVKMGCGKTLLYKVCVLPAEDIKVENDKTATVQAALGPNPTKCQRITITRKQPPVHVVLANINKIALSGKILDIDPEVLILTVYIHDYHLNKKYGPAIKYAETESVYNTETRKAEKKIIPNRKNFSTFESITLPSQRTYPIRLMSKMTSEAFVPSQQFVKGGLEASSDISKILENDGFSVGIFSNNITPHIRDIFGDQSSAQLVLTSTSVLNANLPRDGGYLLNAVTESGGFAPSGTRDPEIPSFVGYGLENNPVYELSTFSSFHDALQKYYNDKAISIQGPAVSFSADLFCSSISSGLQDILSVNNGLSSLNITLGEAGLNLKCHFNSRPDKAAKMETLIYKNKPNIKFTNMNSLT